MQTKKGFIGGLVGILIAVFVFHSLQLVAVATVIFTFMGIAIGWFYIHKFSGLTLKKACVEIFRTNQYLIKQSVGFVKQRLKRGN